jgi:tol-pal system protein YbgF
MMLRLVMAALAFFGGALCGPGAAFAQSNASDLLVRIDHLENELRQLTGLVEQMQYRNQQLEAALKRMQEDSDNRFQELGARGSARAPTGRPAANAIQPAAPAPAVRRSDAFDPSEHPNAPGAPRTLGSIYGNAVPQPPSNAGTPVIAAEEPPPRAAGTPLDLGPAAAGIDPAQSRPAPARPGTPGAPGAAGGFALATAPPSPSPRDSFDLAYGYLQRRDYPLAEATFRDFLKKYPSDRLAAEAQYWLGESLFLRQSYRDAADAFLAMSKKFESSPKAPDALLRLGQSLAALDEKELACATFGEVVRKYPRASAGVKQSVEREQKRVRC